MTRLKSLIIFSVVMANLIFAPLARSQDATTELRGSIDAVLGVLNNPSLQGPQKTKERRDAIMKIVEDRFDFMEMSRLALARYWKQRTDAEKKEFVDLFPKILEAAYVNKIEKYNGEKIAYAPELKFDSKAVVRTKIITRSGTQVPVNYRVMKEAKGWMVYDVVIEGVSLVNNYRNQFNDILSRKPYPELVKMLQEKVKGL